MSRVGALAQIWRQNALSGLHYTRRGLQLIGDDGETVGFLDRVAVQGRQIFVEGWTDANRLRLGDQNGFHCILRPSYVRHDVNEAMGFDPGRLTGFSGELQGYSQLRIEYRETRGGDWKPCRSIRLHSLRREARVLAIGGAKTLGMLTHSPKQTWQALRSSGDTRHGLFWEPDSHRSVLPVFPVPADLMARVPSAAPGACKPATVVMPVYNALELLRESLPRALENAAPNIQFLVIEDCSTDTAVRPWLQAWAARNPDRVQLIENPKNLGFIGSVNRAFSMIKSGHVILLNSDAMVPKNWTNRLLAPLEQRDVATVTPLSNDAEVLSVPVKCSGLALQRGQVDAIDASLSQLNPAYHQVQLPTGVGFCMAMSRRFLSKIPQFDPVFGAGYGEEVDWCQKARSRGGVHIGLANLFVEHHSGQSFGAQAKAELLKRNNALIEHRYQGYDRRVQDFIQSDPLVAQRLFCALAWVGTLPGPSPVYIGHTLGGGAEVYLQELLAAHTAQGRGAVVLRDDFASGIYKIEVWSPAGVTSAFSEDLEALLDPLDLLGAKTLTYSCAVSARHPLEFLNAVLAQFEASKDRIEVLFHDFFPLCPSYNLLDNTGSYCDLPELARCRTCLSAPNPHAAVRDVDIDTWRGAWSAIFEQAARVEVFSQSSLSLVLRAFPQVEGRLHLKPHTMRAQIAPLPVTRPETPTIGVLGNIGYQKGAQIVQQMAASGQCPEIVVLGKIDPAYARSGVTAHGVYELSEIPDLVRQYGITVWLQPAIWPETFSYTTHEMLATGLPVVGFELGAQGGALRTAETGAVVPLDGGAAALTVQVLDVLAQPVSPSP